MSTIPSLKDVSHLYKAHQALTQGTADPEHVIHQLPDSLRQRIQNLSPPQEPSRSRQLLLSIRDLTHEIYSSESNEVKAKIHGVFYKCCGVSNSGGREWGENHINDYDKIDSLLKSLEIISVEKEVLAWAAADPNHKFAAQQIMRFMSSQDSEYNFLNLSRLNLTSLPDIFDNTEMNNRLANLELSDN
ncbi:MAG: hypothetical protein FJZ57_03930 [Chlamydiae bacterium]|nr:hypothetical protein [Chlamydiota bacterium]